MTIKYKNVQYRFNVELFAMHCLQAREKLGYTQAQIADYMGMESANGYGRIERGGLPTLQSFFDLCNMYELRPSVYVDDTTE